MVHTFKDYVGSMTHRCALLVFTVLVALNISPLTIVPLTVFPSVASAQESAVYHVKGIIKALPGNGRAANEVLIKHEQMPDYRDISGKVVGMHGMTMPFYLAPGVSVEGLSIGDDVSFELSASWKPTFTEQITSIRKLETTT